MMYNDVRIDILINKWLDFETPEEIFFGFSKICFSMNIHFFTQGTLVG